MAYQNTRRGKPQFVHWDFPRFACRAIAYGGSAAHGTLWGRRMDLDPRFPTRPRPPVRDLLFQRMPELLRSVGQLLYYVQAVDVSNDAAFRDRQGVYHEALSVANMTSGTCGLMSFCPFFMGMRMKLTKKIMAPELVQEAGGEVVGCGLSS